MKATLLQKLNGGATPNLSLNSSSMEGPTSSIAGGGLAASAASARSVRPHVAGRPALSAVARSHLPGGGPCMG